MSVRPTLVRLCLLSALVAVWQPARARAQSELPPPGVLEGRGLSAAEIARLAGQLGGAQGRADAYHALIELHEESLPGIAARLTALRRSRPDTEAAKAAFTAFRHALGSRRGDDVIDLAQGVLPALAERRDASLLAMAEPLLLLRALERMATREAGLRMADIFTLDAPGVWDFELHLARDRVGLRLLPALIALRSHGDARVRAWAQQGVHALGMEDPAVATNQSDAHLAAEVIRAYSDPLDFDAMPLLVRLTAADKLEVREAARAAVARFGKNAVWQTRQLYSEVAGKGADKRWDAERTARELYAVLDRSQREQAGALLAKGMSDYVSGRLPEMQKSYDALLAQYPRFEEREKMAPGYAALGDALLEEDKLEAAHAAYQRALRLAPEASDAEQLRGKLAFTEAELSLTDGVVDLHGYDQALHHDPQLSAAADIKDRLSGQKAVRERRNKRLAAGAAIALLCGFMLVMLRSRRGAIVHDARDVQTHA
jgi:tetratricopeptide (TPR) repeat protein